MIENKLPINEMDDKDWVTFRDYLNRDFLSDKVLEKIEGAFGIDSENLGADYLNCDDAHAHSYKCFGFRDRISAVVSRLLIEIREYQERLNKIRKETEYKK